MPRNVGRFSCLLLFLQGAWAAFTVQVPPSPVQAAPRSNAYLPCYFVTDPPRPINFDFLVVRWTLRGRIIAKFDASITSFRPRGAVLDSMQLRRGNATLFLLDVRDEDAGEYTCFVIHTPDSSEGKVALKIEVPPRLTLGPTKVQLGKPSNVTCAASNFYPGNLSVSWLQDGETLKVDTPPVQHRFNGLFYAESVLEFTPKISDADATFSCHIHHQASKDPISQDFELHLQARPDLHVLTRSQGKAFLIAECLVCGFYPQNLKVQWLENGVSMPHMIYKSDLVQNPNGTFSMQSLILPQQSDAAASYTCQVQHEAMEEPLEKTVPWQPDEGDEISHPSSPEYSTKSPWPKLKPASPTDPPSVPGLSASQKGWLLGLFGFLLGLGLGVGVMILYYKKRVGKYEQAVQSDETFLEKMDKDDKDQEGKAI